MAKAKLIFLASFIAPRKYFTLFSCPRSGVGTQFRHVSVVVRMDSGRDAPGTGTKHRLDTGRKCKPRNEGCLPRHREIVDELARQICKDLGLPFLR